MSFLHQKEGDGFSIRYLDYDGVIATKDATRPSAVCCGCSGGRATYPLAAEIINSTRLG